MAPVLVRPQRAVAYHTQLFGFVFMGTDLLKVTRHAPVPEKVTCMALSGVDNAASNLNSMLVLLILKLLLINYINISKQPTRACCY